MMRRGTCRHDIGRGRTILMERRSIPIERVVEQRNGHAVAFFRVPEPVGILAEVMAATRNGRFPKAWWQP